jgi:hypothetical protein
VSARQAQLWLGHHSPAFTLATYVHLIPDDLPDPTFLDDLTAARGNNVATRQAQTGRDTDVFQGPEMVEIPGETRSAEVAVGSF